jgi:protein involved in polysaccharide export with SLBB domain
MNLDMTPLDLGAFRMNILTKSVVVLASLMVCGFLVGCENDVDHLREFLIQPRSPVSATEYRVLPPDRISIGSQHVVDINGVSQQLTPDGKVNLPLLGEVYVADHTPKEIQEILKKAASKYYEEVDATVVVTGYSSRKIYVFGQVGRPGPVAYTGTDTLVDLLAQVQPTNLAWPEKIKIVRGGAPQIGGFMPLDRDRVLKAQLEAEKEKERVTLGVVTEDGKISPPADALKTDPAAVKPADPAVVKPADPAAATAKDQPKDTAAADKPKTGTVEPAKDQPKDASADGTSGATLAKVQPDKPAGDALTPLQREDFTESVVMTINMMDMVKKGDMSQNILLKPGDIVYVPANPLAEIGLAFQMLLFPISPAIQTVSSPASAAAAVGTGGAIR